MSRTHHHRRASSVSSLSCSSFDTNEEEYMATEKNWFATSNIVPLPTPANNGQRMQTEMTILACSSPEIQALHKAYYATNSAPKNNGPRNREAANRNLIAQRNTLPTSPTSSITSYSSMSRTDAVLILSSLDQISRNNENDDMLSSDTLQTIDHFQPSSYNQYQHDNTMPPPMFHPMHPPTRNNLMFGTHEIAPQTSYRSLELPFPADPQFHGSRQAALNRSGSEQVFSQTTLRKPSFHRRVSHDSLPSPTEIAAFPPAVVPPAPSSARLYHGRNGARVVHPANVYDYPRYPC